MAKTVGDLLIKLGVDGIEGVTQLKSALTGLSKAAGPADAGLIKLGKAIKAFNRDGNASRDVIAGKLSALKSLRNQAGLNGAAFRALTKDIVDYQQKLAAADKQIDETTRKVSTLAQVSSQIPGRKAGTFGNQIAAFNEELKDLSVTSDKYATVLRNIQERTRSFQRAQARQGVIAAGRTGEEGPADPRTAFQVTTELPRTTAALSLRLTELREDFANIAIGSKDYVNALREINSLEAQIGDPFGTAARKQQIRGRLGQQEQFGMFAPRDPVQSAIARRERRRSRRYGGFAGGGMANQPLEASGLFRTIASIGSADTTAATEMMGRSLAQVTAEINRQAAASKGSINSLQAQRTAFAQLRAGLDPTSQDFRELGKEIEKVDRRLERLNKRRRRPTIGGAASALGGIAAGGVFGGPEGAIGGAVGGVFGGVPGVAVGAAFGAQVKMMREALGATSDYAAQLQKLEIALQGVAGAEYTDALKAAGEVTKELNVPQEVAIRGMTRLSAAVIGAGGNVADAEVVFRNVTSAIKATGGGAQDVESAITAMVQTFSKGKVSAEELSGQLGERLPGAVTQFAEANNMTLPELQKAFKAGSVGLNELMKFILSLGPEYAKTAKQIANSSADAGARAQVAFNEVRIAVGESLQPIGAQFQIAFAEFVTDILPALVVAAKAAAAAIKGLLDFAAILVANFEELASAALVLASAIGTAGLVKASMAAGSAMNVLKLALFDVKLAVAGLGKALLFLTTNPIVLLVAGVTAAGVALYRAATANDRFVKSIDDGKTTLDEAKDKAEDLNAEINKMQERLDKTSNNRLIQSLRRQLAGLHDDLDDINEAMERAIYREFGGGAGFVGPVIPGMKAADERPEPELTNFKPPTGEDDTGGGREPMSEVELQLRRQMREAIEAENLVKQSLVQLELDLLAAALEVEDVNRRINLEEQAQADHQQRMNDFANKGLKVFEEQEALRRQATIQVREAMIAASGLNEEEMKRIEIMRQLAAFAAKFKDVLTDEEMLKFLQDLRDALVALQNETNDTGESFDELFRKKLDDMMKVAPKLADVAGSAIGKISDGLVEMIATGEANFKKMAASILKDIAKILLQAAIARTITMFLKPAADGAVVQGGRIKPYAKGGVVAEPTMFPMAGGDVGLMGEAGPEAIMPLKRGANGKLGVEVAARSNAVDAMNRYSRRNTAAAADGGMASEDEAIAAVQGSATQPIDVRYTVERINNVDYVTADQFQSGMRQAANQGAKQGEQQTLKRLQMSSSTRKRLGM